LIRNKETKIKEYNNCWICSIKVKSFELRLCRSWSKTFNWQLKAEFV